MFFFLKKPRSHKIKLEENCGYPGKRRGFPSGVMIKNLPDNAGDAGDTVQSLYGEDPLEYLKNPMGREAWWIIVHGVPNCQT